MTTSSAKRRARTQRAAARAKLKTEAEAAAEGAGIVAGCGGPPGGPSLKVCAEPRPLVESLVESSAEFSTESPTSVQSRLAFQGRGCVVCEATTTLQRCFQCHTARYCSRRCQRAHWGFHKPRCKKNPQFVGQLGLTGIDNMGATCYLNSAIQCLSSIPDLAHFFISNQFEADVNKSNCLGTGGELACSFATLLKDLWFGDKPYLRPSKQGSLRGFVAHVRKHAGQFTPYQHHDAQEFLGFLLDSLHEDLNRVVDKPYCTLPDSEGRPDLEVAKEWHENHIARNKSMIVDLFHGQFKSTLSCDACAHENVTFDPYNLVSLPIPGANNIVLSVYYVPSDGSVPFKFCLALKKGWQILQIKEKLLEELQKTREEATLDGTEIFPEVKYPNQLTVTGAVPGRFWKYYKDSTPVLHLRTTAVTVYQVDSAQLAQRAIEGMIQIRCLVGEAAVEASILTDAKEVQEEKTQPEAKQKARKFIASEKFMPIIIDVARNHAEDIAHDERRSLMEGVLRDQLEPEYLYRDKAEAAVITGRQLYEMIRRRLTRFRKTDCKQGDPVEAVAAEAVAEQLSDLTLAEGDPVEAVAEQLSDMTLAEGGSAEAVTAQLSDLTLKGIEGAGVADEAGAGSEADSDTDADERAAATEVAKKIAERRNTTDWGFKLWSSKKLGVLERRLYDDDADVGIADRGKLCIDVEPGLWDMDQVEAVVTTPSCEKVKPVDVRSCLNSFSNKEMMEGDDSWYCPKCKKHVTASKKMQLWKTPKILVLHLKRFSHSNDRQYARSGKISCPVQLPLTLDLTEDVLGPQQEAPIYELFGVVNHTGTMDYGHYTASVLHQAPSHQAPAHQATEFKKLNQQQQGEESAIGPTEGGEKGEVEQTSRIAEGAEQTSQIAEGAEQTSQIVEGAEQIAEGAEQRVDGEEASGQADGERVVGETASGHKEERTPPLSDKREDKAPVGEATQALNETPAPATVKETETKEQWFHFNDELVKPNVPLRPTCAYILFYRRKEQSQDLGK